MMEKGQVVASMTGFGAASETVERTTIDIDVRSVNSRYLDIVVRAPDDLRALELTIRELVAKMVSRGKIEVRVNVRQAIDLGAMQLNADALDALLGLQAKLAAASPDTRALSAADILRWPGVLAEPVANAGVGDALHAAVLKVVTSALHAHAASRAREGDALCKTILARLAQARAIRATLVPAAQRVRAEYPARLRGKIESSGVVVDAERLAQEIVLHAQKIDIDEELDRLNAHFDEVERVLSKGGDVGKRLDFLMQELNRESNTLGSKSVDTECTRGAIDLKVLIEQMREQVQNLQ
jgi:uncharacterized protein (TIGR00255 family)